MLTGTSSTNSNSCLSAEQYRQDRQDRGTHKDHHRPQGDREQQATQQSAGRAHPPGASHSWARLLGPPPTWRHSARPSRPAPPTLPRHPTPPGSLLHPALPTAQHQHSTQAPAPPAPWASASNARWICLHTRLRSPSSRTSAARVTHTQPSGSSGHVCISRIRTSGPRGTARGGRGWKGGAILDVAPWGVAKKTGLIGERAFCAPNGGADISLR